MAQLERQGTENAVRADERSYQRAVRGAGTARHDCISPVRYARAAATEHLAFFTYADRPGIVGIVGRLLGEHGVNIASMQVSGT